MGEKLDNVTQLMSNGSDIFNDKGKSREVRQPHKWLARIGISMSLGFLLLFNPTNGYGFSEGVEPLPADNLLYNPWFHSINNTSVASLEGWTNDPSNKVDWGTSDKPDNPSPYGEMGTAARWAVKEDTFYSGIDVYLYQVVAANPDYRTLKFSTWWVSHRIDILEVTVYGGDIPTGPWSEIWTPFSETVPEAPKPPPEGEKADLWIHTSVVETMITRGYPYYKVEIHARYPEPQEGTGRGNVGVKITGVYFAAGPESGGNPLPNPSHFMYLPLITR